MEKVKEFSVGVEIESCDELEGPVIVRAAEFLQGKYLSQSKF